VLATTADPKCVSFFQQSAASTNANAKPTTTAGGAHVDAATLAKNLPHTLNARYKVGDVIGEGGYSVVKSGTSVIDERKVAIKIITRKDLSETDDESLKQEVAILGKLKHPNVTRLVDFFEEEQHYYVVLEYLDGGELFDRIVKKTYYSEKEARDLVFTILKAIKYCHDQNIVHRFARFTFTCIFLHKHLCCVLCAFCTSCYLCCLLSRVRLCRC